MSQETVLTGSRYSEFRRGWFNQQGHCWLVGTIKVRKQQTVNKLAPQERIRPQGSETMQKAKSKVEPSHIRTGHLLGLNNLSRLQEVSSSTTPVVLGTAGPETLNSVHVLCTVCVSVYVKLLFSHLYLSCLINRSWIYDTEWCGSGFVATSP